MADNETYGALREENRVVMRHQIALNLDSFRAAPDDFVPRQVREYPPLQDSTPPFMSVIVPTYNAKAYMETVLKALSHQTFGDYEVIVVDDASTDDSVAWIERNYPHARLLVNRQNAGFARACNLGAAAARGRFLVFLNNDTEPEPTWLAELAKSICAHPEAAVFASKLLLFDDRKTLHAAGDLLGRDGIPRNRGVWEQDRGQYDGEDKIFGGCGGAVAYRANVWQALGGFDEDYWMYLEDVDLAFRAQMMGWRAVFIPQARVYHHLSATGGGAMASYYVGRNTIWTIAKNMPASLVWRNLPNIMSGQLRIAVDALRHWRGEAARARFRGQVVGLVSILTPLRKRHLVQSRRLVDDDELQTLLAP